MRNETEDLMNCAHLKFSIDVFIAHIGVLNTLVLLKFIPYCVVLECNGLERIIRGCYPNRQMCRYRGVWRRLYVHTSFVFSIFRLLVIYVW